MKKYILIIFLLIIIIIIIFSLFNVDNNNNNVVPLSKETNYIFTSEYNNNLYIVVNNELQIFNNGTFQNSMKLSNGMTKAYLDGNSIYFIDNNNNFNILNLKDKTETTLIQNIIDFYIDTDLIAIIADDKLLYIYNKQEINEYITINQVARCKNVRLKNGYLLLLDDFGNVYETYYSNTQLSKLNFNKINELQDIENIICGYGNMAISKNGNIYYWFDDYDSNSINPYIDNPSMISEKLSFYNVCNCCLGNKFGLGWNKDGKAYFWGEKGESKNTKNIDYIRNPTIIKSFNHVDMMYISKSAIYIQEGLNITEFML